MKTLASYTTASKSLTVTDFLLNIIPTTFVNAFAQGEILQVLLIAVLFGMALLIVGEAVALLVSVLSQVSKALFGVVAIVMRAAPIGAFGAMAFTVGRFGLGSLLVLGKLMAGVYATCLLFIFVVLGGIAAATGFSLLKFLAYIREEIFIVVGTSSSESVLPRMMEKLERLGCPKSVVGLVIPTGYSFNLDGTSIYMGQDNSEKRMCEWRCFDAVDTMNNMYANTGLRPKYIIADIDTYRKGPEDDTYANFPVNYLRLDKVPGPDDDETPVLKALRDGNFFVTNGEVLIKSYSVDGTGPKRTINADVEWTYPLSFVEVVWGDGKKIDRQIIPATDLGPFSTKKFSIPFDATGKAWVRFAVWDSAGDGAFVQPIWLNAPKTTN